MFSRISFLVIFSGLLNFATLSIQLFAQNSAATPTTVEELLAAERFSLAKNRVAAPNFKLKDLESKTVSLSSYKGKVVLINFWTSWCAPCREEMPSMENLYQKFGGPGNPNFEIIALNQAESKAKASKFIQEMGVNFKILLDETGAQSAVYGVYGLPGNFIVDKEGLLVARLIGAYDFNRPAAEEIIRRLIAE